jgi:hypothetical protein
MTSNKYIKIFISAFIILSLSGLYSCKKLLDINSPAGELTSDKIFVDNSSATAATVAMYSRFTYNTSLNSDATLTAGLAADEIADFNNNYQAFQLNSIQINNSTNAGLWTQLYNVIYYANALIEGLSNNDKITKSLANTLTAEGKFMRAVCYFELVNLYGEIPLITSTDVTISSKLGRTSTTDVYTQIIKDLQEAQTALPETYITTERIRANKYAATALLARVYLYQEKWSDAEAQSTLVIQNSQYDLNDDLNAVFTKNNSEAILQFWTSEGYNDLADQFIPGGVSPNMYLTSSFMAGIENGDKRMTNWMNSIEFNGQTYYYPAKYKNTGSDNITQNEYLMFLRLGEQYLIRAEARAEAGNLTGAQADLNKIRVRAGLDSVIIDNKTDLLSAIEKERRIELFTEWGHRWFDLKRTNRVDNVMIAEKPLNWKSTAALFPIPIVEINANPNLKQNPGYN